MHNIDTTAPQVKKKDVFPQISLCFHRLGKSNYPILHCNILMSFNPSAMQRELQDSIGYKAISSSEIYPSSTPLAAFSPM